MTSDEPKVNPNGLYGLTETAAILGVSRATITRAANSLDKNKRIQYQIRRSTGKRVFPGQGIINYWRLKI